jgi:hypothetical protein
VGRQIFAIGGIMDGGYTSTVERYDPDSDIWMEVDPMTQGRCNPGVAVAGGKIYVSGKSRKPGFIIRDPQRGVECEIHKSTLLSPIKWV